MFLLFKLHGSCVVTMLAALDKQHRLDVQNFPGLEYFLRYTIDYWDNQLDYEPDLAAAGFHLDNSSSDAKVVPYIDVCRAIAWKLFKDQTEEDRALHLAFVEEWLEWLEPTEEDFGYSEWIRKWLEDNWRWLRLGTQDAWYNAGKDVVSVELSEYQDLDLQKTWAEFSEHKRENPLVPPKGSSWEVMDWNDVGCKVRLRSKSYSEDDTDEEEDDTEEEGSDTESMGWGGERPFWRM